MIFKERQRRFTLLLKRYDNQAHAAECLGFGGVAGVSNIKTGQKNMGESVARRIETMASLARGTFTDPLSTPFGLQEPIAINKDGPHFNSDTVLSDDFLQLDWLYKEAGDVQKAHKMSVSKDWLKSSGLSADQVKAFVMPDDSQPDFVRRGYRIGVNTQWAKPLKHGHYYAIRLGGSVTVRRIEYRSNGDLVLCCSSESYSDEVVPPNAIDDLPIEGQAVIFQGAFPAD